MHARSASVAFLSLLLVVAFAGISFAATAGDVLINEIHVNSGDFYDGSEYIELYNTTPDSIDLTGWVLSGIEFDEVCGEHHHEFPSGSGVPGYGYFLVVRDAQDGDGFIDRFGMRPVLQIYGLEMYDSDQVYEVDDAGVTNTTCQNPDSYDNQIRFATGNKANGDYGGICPSGGRYEVLWLYDSPSRTNLIDAMEYRYEACNQDQCLGVGGSDNDAYPRYPDEGISLGRDDLSSDTDTSNIDFHEMATTPFAQNVMTLPPRVWTLRYDPCVPEPLVDNITISVYAADDDGTIASVVCYVDIDSTGFVPYPMTALPSDSLYTCQVPPQADQSQGMFYVVATDNQFATTTYPGDAPEGSYHFSIGLTAIQVVQGTFRAATGPDSSAYAGQAKNIAGIVTAARGDYYLEGMFVIQDGFGNYSGIHVFDPTYSVPAERGDSVIVSGLVIEYYNRTELQIFSGCYEERGSGYPLPNPIVLTTTSLATGTAGVERYEGVLVRTEGLVVTDDSLGTYQDEWAVNDGSGPCRVGADGDYFYNPSVGDSLVALQGVCDYNYSDYKIEPRDDDDIEGPLSVHTVRYTPHAPTSSDQVTVTAIVEADTTITSAKLFYSTNGGASFDSTDMSGVGDDYSAVIGPYPNDTVVDYYVEAWDVEGYTDRRPIAGSYDFRVGITTIYDVQYVTGGQDSSAYAGEPVNVSGIVTADSADFSGYYFFIQNSYGGPDTPEFDGIRIYDRTGTGGVGRGDSVTVSGDVWEYYNQTEIAMFFPEAITIHSTGNTVPAPYVLTATAIATSEEYEGVLVQADCAEVVDDDLGYGEWMIQSCGVAGDTCRVDDEAYYDYEPVQGECLSYVRGVVQYTFNRYKIEPRNSDDIGEVRAAGIDDVPRGHALAMRVRPNPMMDGGTIRFSLPATDRVGLKIYNVQGALVKTLVDRSVDAGSHRIDWNATNDRGIKVTSGIYFIRLDTRRGSVVNKVVVSR